MIEGLQLRLAPDVVEEIHQSLLAIWILERGGGEALEQNVLLHPAKTYLRRCGRERKQQNDEEPDHRFILQFRRYRRTAIPCNSNLPFNNNGPEPRNARAGNSSVK